MRNIDGRSVTGDVYQIGVTLALNSTRDETFSNFSIYQAQTRFRLHSKRSRVDKTSRMPRHDYQCRGYCRSSAIEPREKKVLKFQRLCVKI